VIVADRSFRSRVALRRADDGEIHAREWQIAVDGIVAASSDDPREFRAAVQRAGRAKYDERRLALYTLTLLMLVTEDEVGQAPCRDDIERLAHKVYEHTRLIVRYNVNEINEILQALLGDDSRLRADLPIGRAIVGATVTVGALLPNPRRDLERLRAAVAVAEPADGECH
jgi:hypothetical protein